MKLFLFVLCVLMTPVLAEWRALDVPAINEEHYTRSARVHLIYKENKTAEALVAPDTLADVLRKLDEEGRVEMVKFMRPWGLTDSPEFQGELIKAFRELVPEDWTAAEKSAGNMHNPKMRALRPHLSKAFMQTTLAKEISRDLALYDLKITEFGAEKLSYSDRDGKRMIYGIFHIEVGLMKAAEDSPAGESEEQTSTK